MSDIPLQKLGASNERQHIIANLLERPRNKSYPEVRDWVEALGAMIQFYGFDLDTPLTPKEAERLKYYIDINTVGGNLIEEE
jgi:hypothetical protein